MGFLFFLSTAGGRAHRTARCSPRRSPAPRWYMLYLRRYCRLPRRRGLPRYILRVYGAHHPQMGEDRTPTAAATGTSIIGCRARPWDSRARDFPGLGSNTVHDRSRSSSTASRRYWWRSTRPSPPRRRWNRKRRVPWRSTTACCERHAVWKSTNELGCHNCGAFSYRWIDVL